MTFSRIKTVGWQVNEKVTSPQLNQLDLDHFNSLDKTGDNATNGGGISGRIDVLSGGTLRVNTGGVIDVEGGLIEVGVTTSGGQTFNNASYLYFNDTSGLTFNGTGNLIMGSGASYLSAGITNITSGGTLGLNSGATMHVKSGATEYVDSGGKIEVSNGGQVLVDAGGNSNYSSGANLNLNAGSYLNATNQTTTFTGASQLVILAGGTTMITSGSSFVTIASGSTFTVASGASAKMADFPTFVTPLMRPVIESTTSGIAIAGTWAGGLQFVYDTGTGGVWAQQLQRCHHGATLYQVFVGLSVGSSHSAVPATRPALSIIRYHWTGMFAPAALSTVDPQYFPNPGSGSAYYNSGNQQFMNYICNQNNVIDNENYIYVLEISDESGAGSAANNAFGLIYLDHRAIPSLKWNI